MNTIVGQLTLATIKEAMTRISPLVHQSPLQGCRTLSEITGHHVYLKLENMQKTGSFKIRGAANKIYSLAKEEAASGVISASAGNHAQGVAWAAEACGVPSVVVMPLKAPIAKVRATQGYGAQVVLYGDNYDEAYQHACQIQEKTGMTFIHAFDDDAVIAGQGTIALEIMRKMFDVETIVAPIGGGGLLAGLAVAAKEHNPKIRLIGVQAQGAPAMAESLVQNHVICLPEVKTIADGIAVKKPGALPFQYIQKYIDEIILVNEDELKNAICFMIERGKIITEGAGAAGVAAVLGGKISGVAQKVAVVVSGGNIDPILLSEVIHTRYKRAVG